MLRYNHDPHAQTTVTWLLKLTQGSDIFGDALRITLYAWKEKASTGLSYIQELLLMLLTLELP